MIKTQAILTICLCLSLFQCKLIFDDDDNTATLDNEIDWIELNHNSVDTTSYFVSMNGNDNNNGRSRSNAFSTLKKAFQSVKPGGKINILPGVYNEDIGLIKAGMDSDSILIQGIEGIPILYGKQEKIVGIYCERCRNLVFDNIKFSNYTDIGLSLESCQNIRIRNLIIQKNGFDVQLENWEFEGYGIHVEGSDNVLITNCDVSENGPNPQIFPNFLMGTGINTYGNTNVIIRNNRCHKNIGGGILVEDSEDVLVEGNIVYENDLDATVDEWWDGGLWIDGGHRITVRNNVFRNNLGPGIEISDEDNQNPTGYILENNICTDNYYGIYIWNFGTTDWPDEHIIQNNNNQFTDNTIQNVWIQP